MLWCEHGHRWSSISDLAWARTSTKPVVASARLKEPFDPPIMEISFMTSVDYLNDRRLVRVDRYPARVRWRTTISRTPTSSRRSLSAVLYWISARSRVGIARSVIARSRPDVRRADVLARLDSRTG